MSAQSDEGKVALILKEIGHENIALTSIQRLGVRQEGQTYGRPIKITVPSPQVRRTILQNSKNLKQAGHVFKKIYVKRDMHPAFRKEMGRLRESEKREREKPENQGRDVRYDRTTRVLTVDGAIVDRFNPTFF